MNKQILIAASTILLSINTLASNCDGDPLLGIWKSELITKTEDKYDPCGNREVINTSEYDFISIDGKITGSGFQNNRMNYSNPSCPSKERRWIFKLITPKNGNLIMTADTGQSAEFKCDLKGATMTIEGKVFNKTSDSNIPTTPNDPNAPFVPEVCWNCPVLVNHHPLQYPPPGTSEICNPENLQGTWKETKDFTDAEGEYCQWKHKTVEVITFDMSGNNPYIQGPQLNGRGYIKGEHTLLKKADGWNCKTVIEDREYTKIEMGKLNSGHTTGDLTIHDIRPNPNYPMSTKITGMDLFPACTVYGGKFLVFGRAEKRRLEKQ